MVTNNSVITAPIGIAEVESVIGTAGHDLGTLCKKNSINVWARFKPTIGGRIQDRKINSRKDEGERYSVLYGLAYYDSQGSLVPRNNIIPNVTESNFNSPIKWNIGIDWTSTQIQQNFYRLQDFNGYKHDAVIPVGNYQFLPQTTVATQTGPFFNNNSTIFGFVSLKASSASGIPLPKYGGNYMTATDGVKKCWEDVSAGHSIEYYGQLYLEDLLEAAKIDSLPYDNIGEMYLGIMFKFDSYYAFVNTRIKFSTILNGSGNTKTLIAYDDTTSSATKRIIGNIAYGSGNLLLSLNLKNIAETGGVWVFNSAESKYVYARSILTTETYHNIPAGVTPATNEQVCGVYVNSSFPSSYNIYSLQLDTNFGNGGAYFNKLKTFVSVISNTNRDGTRRNAGKWFDSTESGSITDSVDYEYVNGNWSQKSVGHPPRTINSHCSLSADKTNRYIRNQDGSYTRSTSSSAVYVRYSLKLRGYICCEFRASKGTTVTDNYFLPTAESAVEKRVSLLMKFPTGVQSIQVGNNYMDVTTNGISVGSAISDFRWTGASVVTDGHLIYCDKNYGNSTASVDKCHSEMFKLNYLPDFNDQTSYYDDNVYLYVQRTAVSTPASLHINFEYSFGPDVDNNYETFTIEDQSGNTDIYDNTSGGWNLS